MRGLDLRPLVYNIVGKAALIVLIALSYFYVLRPARQYYTANLVAPQVRGWTQSDNTSASFEPKSSKSFYISFSLGDIQKEMIYSPQFGFFLLIAAIGLVFITLKWHYYIFLLGLHLIFELLVMLNLWLGAMYVPVGFLFADFIISYLAPLVSLGLIPTVLFYDTKNANFLNH